MSTRHEAGQPAAAGGRDAGSQNAGGQDARTAASAGTPLRLTLANLSKSFDGAEVLHGISFDEDVRALAIIGPSGSGKSTLLRIIGGLEAPTCGTITVDGRPIGADEKSLRAYRATLGFVFQDSGLFHHMSALENVALPLRVVHQMVPAAAEKRARELLERLGLAEAAAKRPAQLSGGQKQRVAIARALAARPRLLLLDEPTSALDPEFTTEVLDVVRDLAEEGTRFIIVTHEMGFARRACDAVAFLCGGRLAEYGPSERVFEHPETPELQRFLSRLLEWSW